MHRLNLDFYRPVSPVCLLTRALAVARGIEASAGIVRALWLYFWQALGPCMKWSPAVIKGRPLARLSSPSFTHSTFPSLVPATPGSLYSLIDLDDLACLKLALPRSLHLPHLHLYIHVTADVDKPAMPAERTTTGSRSRPAPLSLNGRPTSAGSSTRDLPRRRLDPEPRSATRLPPKAKLTHPSGPTTPEDALYSAVVGDERRQHHYFWAADGDFVFTAGSDALDRNSIFFRVKSEIFFGRSMPLTQLANKGAGKVWRLKGEIVDWENLLGLFTNKCASLLPIMSHLILTHFFLRSVHARNTPTLRETLSAFTLAHHYKMPVVRTWAECVFPLSPSVGSNLTRLFRSHLRADFFYTPDDVRTTLDDKCHAFPGTLDCYSMVLAIPDRMNLDPRVRALALYFGMLNFADEQPQFSDKHPAAAEAICKARQKLWEFWAWLLQELVQIPDNVFHDDGGMPCKAALLSWFPREDPEDVLGVIGTMLQVDPRSHGCCDGCRVIVSETVQQAFNKAWHYLPCYFDCYVPNVEQGWLIPNATTQFLGNESQTL